VALNFNLEEIMGKPLPQPQSTFKVKVRTTNVLNNTTTDSCVENDEEKPHYYPCENGVLFVITDDPRKIYEWLPNEAIESIEKIGVGYSL